MQINEKSIITVETNIKIPIHKVWLLWTQPEHIVNWNFASDDWHSPKAENDFTIHGKFSYRMEAKDGSTGFNFSGRYTKIEYNSAIEFTLDDDRKVKIHFTKDGNNTVVKESFEAENINSTELQQAGWQAILNNFKKYAESFGELDSVHFEVKINNDAKAVYQTMLDKEHYKVWTAEFNPTSHYEGSWKKGSTIKFLGTDENGKTGGMIGQIIENAPNKFVCIEYKGIISDGKEKTSGDETEGWIGGLENYTFIENNGETALSVDLVANINPEFKSYFSETYPKALNKLKSLCEEAK